MLPWWYVLWSLQRMAKVILNRSKVITILSKTKIYSVDKSVTWQIGDLKQRLSNRHDNLFKSIVHVIPFEGSKGRTGDVTKFQFRELTACGACLHPIVSIRDMFRGKNRLSPPEDAIDERLSHGKTGSVHLRTLLMKGYPMKKPAQSTWGRRWWKAIPWKNRRCPDRTLEEPAMSTILQMWHLRFFPWTLHL